MKTLTGKLGIKVAARKVTKPRSMSNLGGVLKRATTSAWKRKISAGQSGGPGRAMVKKGLD